MCGIAGIVGQKWDRSSGMTRMLQALAHRGPDGEGVEADDQAILGHRRLSIIDLAGGRQPLTNIDKSIWLICNGEIYNYKELRADLESRGHRFLTHSDCEVIIGLYEQYGDDLLQQLRGMFAFALWDSRKRRLLLARDHLGQKPLYYHLADGSIAFASELKSILALDSGLREMNTQALDQYLALRVVAPPLSMFKRIAKLPPAHKLVFEAGRPAVPERYWALRYEPKNELSESQILDALDEKLTESLRLHMVSDVPVGAFLSGGMDSGLIVAMLSKRLGVRNLQTFTVDLPYQRYAEAPHARIVSQKFGTVHHEETLHPSLISSLPDLVWHLDEPSDPLSLCTYLLAEMTRKHVKVVLGGDGGDELFGGYDRYYGNIYAGRYARLPAALRKHVVAPILSFVPEAGWYKSAGHQLRWFQQMSFFEGGARYAASLSYFYFDTEARRALYTPKALEALQGWRGESVIERDFETRAHDPVDRMLCADSEIRLPDHPVMISDRMTMARGLEARSPFMDHKLAEFVARIPVQYKVRGRSLRYIQKELARRYLPPEILDRPKQGFSSALPYLLRDELRTLYSGVLADSSLVRDGVLQGSIVQRLVGEQLTGRRDHGNRLWLLVNAELWYRMMIRGETREQLREELSELARHSGLPQAKVS